MRVSIAVLTGTLLTACLAGPALAGSGVVVTIDQSTPVHLSGSASQVVVANPTIVDASILDRRQIVISGRSYGSTSVMVFDAAGRAIYNGVVTVAPPASNQVALYRGAISHHFTCASHCERTPVPGEPDSGVYMPYANSAHDYAERAKSAAQASGQQP